MSRETFEADWLELREPVDHRSRSLELAERVAAWWARGPRSRVVDLGSGTGSNLRYLAPELPGRQRWTLVDHDGSLLARVRAPTVDVVVELVEADLVDGALGQITGADLVTASALLDLVSRSWVDELVEACVRVRAAALFALSYDGTIAWEPASGSAPGVEEPDDALVRLAVAEHQARDKGFGPALGPDAARAVTDAFRRHGYTIRFASTPWRLGPGDEALARALVEGWAEAAAEVRPDAAPRIEEWRRHRTRTVDAAAATLVVGHVDVLGVPPGEP